MTYQVCRRHGSHQWGIHWLATYSQLSYLDSIHSNTWTQFTWILGLKGLGLNSLKYLDLIHPNSPQVTQIWFVKFTFFLIKFTVLLWLQKVLVHFSQTKRFQVCKGLDQFQVLKPSLLLIYQIENCNKLQEMAKRLSQFWEPILQLCCGCKVF